MPHKLTSAAVVMYGKPVAEQIYADVAAAVPDFVARSKVKPTLAIVQVGHNPASERYVKKKMEACERLGMAAQHHRFESSISTDSLREEVDRLSRAREIHGILVQLPLPRDMEEPAAGDPGKFEVFDAISPDKDVDGISRHSIPELYRAQQDRLRFLPCTPLAVRRMMAFYGIETEGRLAVVVGRNDITAKPLVHMLGGRMCNAGAIWCHRYVPREDQERLIRSADIVISAVGSAHYRITGHMLKPGAVVFDIATRIDEAGKVRGDADFDTASQIASHVTPVPGGVGPVTVAALTENLLRAAQFAHHLRRPGYNF